MGDVMLQLRAAIVARVRELAQGHLNMIGGPGFNRDSDGISTGMAVVLNGQHVRAAKRLNDLADRWERDGIPAGYEEFVAEADRL